MVTSPCDPRLPRAPGECKRLNKSERMNCCLYSACDEAYLRRYGIAFAMAAAKKGWPLHISAISEGNEQTLYGLLCLISESFRSIHRSNEEMSWSIDQPWRAWRNEQQRRIVLCANRFFTAADYLASSKQSLLIVDVDSFIAKSPRKAPPHDRVGLFLRDKDCNPDEKDWRILGKAVLAGIVHVPQGDIGMQFLLDVQKNIKLVKPLRWYVDQVALYRSYASMEDKSSVFCFDCSYMDWRHGEKPLLWTAKGGLKSQDAFYMAKRRRLMASFVRALSC